MTLVINHRVNRNVCLISTPGKNRVAIHLAIILCNARVNSVKDVMEHVFTHDRPAQQSGKFRNEYEPFTNLINFMTN